ncbi:MAG: Rrf2 family transcriptional regulator [Vulcanococcus sp.]
MAPLRRSAVQALQALLELAQQPEQWLSVTAVAAAQGLPAPMLEQLLLELRRAGLVEARRGRQGGYRLARPPQAIRVAEVFSAVGAPLALLEPEQPGARAEQQVLRSLSRRLQQALDRELQGLSLQELLYDLRSWQESLSNDGGVMLG